MRRRDFIILTGSGVAAAWPLAARAQTSRRLGVLFATSLQSAETFGLLPALSQGLKEHGWIEGQNITIESRFADGAIDALPKLAAELIALRVDAIVTDSTPATRAAMVATQTLPILILSNDPVASGFVASLSRPGGNVTGISLLSAEIAGKRLQSQLVAGLTRVCVLSNFSNPSHAGLIQKTQIAGQSLGLNISVAEMQTTPEKLEARVGEL
jgi:putative ABC transport system substrate-binding protein